MTPAWRTAVEIARRYGWELQRPSGTEANVTWVQLARKVAAEFRVVLLDAQADHVLWEHTGFPSFWKGDPEECCTRQLRDFFWRTKRWPPA